MGKPDVKPFCGWFEKNLAVHGHDVVLWSTAAIVLNGEPQEVKPSANDA